MNKTTPREEGAICTKLETEDSFQNTSRWSVDLRDNRRVQKKACSSCFGEPKCLVLRSDDTLFGWTETSKMNHVEHFGKWSKTHNCYCAQF